MATILQSCLSKLTVYTSCDTIIDTGPPRSYKDTLHHQAVAGHSGLSITLNLTAPIFSQRLNKTLAGKKLFATRTQGGGSVQMDKD